jgi:hypothetical protein
VHYLEIESALSFHNNVLGRNKQHVDISKEDRLMAEEIIQTAGRKQPAENHMNRISITDGTTVLYAQLNETVAAKDFIKRLPCRFSGFDSGIDYCCSAANGIYDPLEQQAGWKNGDISLGGGWFAILYGGEEESASYRDMMIIGHLEEASLQKVKQMPARVNLTVESA